MHDRPTLGIGARLTATYSLPAATRIGGAALVFALND